MIFFLKDRRIWDPIGRFIYLLLSYLFYFFFDMFYDLGSKISFNKKKNFFIKFNPLYSFIRGIKTNKKIFMNKFNQIYNRKEDDLIIIATGDTHKKLNENVYKIINDGLFLHLGDFVYQNEDLPFIELFKKNRIIFTPGCREVIPFSNPKWKKEFKKINKNNLFYFNTIKLNNFTVDIFILSNFLIPGSEFYYDQIEWLNINIKNSQAKYKILCSHNPPYSISRHGPDHIIRSIIDRANINKDIHLVLSGHEHTYQRFNINGTPYIISGLGGHSIYNFHLEDQRLVKKYNKNYGFLKLNINKRLINIQFINIDNEIIDNFNILSK